MNDNEDVLKALKNLEREIYNLDIETFCLPVQLGYVKGAYNELSEAITGEEHRWTR